MPSQRVSFENQSGIRLAGILDLPETPPETFALFAHCFTCTKDLKAIVRISRRLASHGVGVLRFDFTGLGDSGGQFSETTFDSNVADIHAAVAWLKEHQQAPQLLIGHSLGGTAMVATAAQQPEANCIVTLASPSNTHHLVDTLFRLNPKLVDGPGKVEIGGRTYLIKQSLLDSLKAQDIDSSLAQLTIPHLVLHSPVDKTLSMDHAHQMFAKTGANMEPAKNYRALVTLPGSDHLLVNQPEDIEFVADLIASWSKRFCR